MKIRVVLAVLALCGAVAIYLAAPPDSTRGGRHAASTAAGAQIPNPAPRGKISDKFPNILLRTHDNKPVRFYDDLVKDRTVIVNFMLSNSVTSVKFFRTHFVLCREQGCLRSLPRRVCRVAS